MSIKNAFPFTRWLRKYSLKNSFPKDILAAITIGIVMIPQSISYSLLAYLPPEYGLYNSVLSSFAHLLFGISPFQSLGPFAVVSLMVGNCLMSLVLHLENTQSSEFPILIPLNAFLTFAVGAVLLALFVTNASKYFGGLFPKHLIEGFTGAAALAIMTSQIQQLFGIKTSPVTGTFTFLKAWIGILSAISRFQGVTFLIGVMMFGLVIFFEALETNAEAIKGNIKKFLFPASENLDGSAVATPSSPKKIKIAWPVILICLLIMTGISYGFDIHGKYGVAIIGYLPSGFPGFSNPFQVFYLIDDRQIAYVIAVVILNAITIALVIYVTILSIVHTFPLVESEDLNSGGQAPDEDEVDILGEEIFEANDLAEEANPNPNVASSIAKILQTWEPVENELLAVTFANILCSLFSGYPSSGSLSRSAILATKTEVRTPIGNFIASGAIVLTVAFLTDFIYYIPLSCLAAVVILSLVGTLKKISTVLILFERGKNHGEWENFSTYVITFTAVIVTDPFIGILIGVGTVMMWWAWKNAFSKERESEQI